ncbi:hypothetical protein [Reyranella sp.]|uniref:hypothetical protein n=1 Tax=Reyranella sp. TaxID=1929291 RepID=UPI00273142B7|nr:hypothetical protein [Reyranella sp.]MDP2373344.1 hypothetical protein [Reyranella sp.]
MHEPSQAVEQSGKAVEQTDTPAVSASTALVPLSAAAEVRPPTYYMSHLAELRQGEVFGNLKYYVVDIDAVDPARHRVSSVTIPYSITASQDCDLLQAYTAWKKELQERTNGVLFFEAEEAAAFKERHKLGAKEIRAIRQHQDSGRHYLGSPGSPLAVPDLIVDFKRYFMIPTKEVYRQIQANEANRHCFLGEPFRSHFQKRAMDFMGRVGLPEEG